MDGRKVYTVSLALHTIFGILNVLQDINVLFNCDHIIIDDYP